MTAYLWTMAVLFALGVLAALNTKPDEVEKPVTARGLVVSTILRTALLVWTVVLLTACGGGDPEDDAPDVPTPGVVCPASAPGCAQ